MRKLLAVVAVAGLLFAACGTGQETLVSPAGADGTATSGINVSGQGKVTGKPDTLSVTLGISLLRPTVDAATGDPACRLGHHDDAGGGNPSATPSLTAGRAGSGHASSLPAQTVGHRGKDIGLDRRTGQRASIALSSSAQDQRQRFPSSSPPAASLPAALRQ